MIEVLSFLSNENCFAGHSRGPCGPLAGHGLSTTVLGHYLLITKRRKTMRLHL